VSVAQSANRNGAYCWIQSGDVTTAGQNSYRTFRQLSLLFLG
jgi:hypothetical protein